MINRNFSNSLWLRQPSLTWLVGLLIMLSPLASNTAAELQPPSAVASIAAVKNTYRVGKAAYQQKLACADCPYANRIIDAQKAQQMIHELQQDSTDAKLLSSAERQAVIHYLKQLFRLE